MHIYLCEKLLTKTTIFELGIGMASSFSGMALNTFWKRAVHIGQTLFQNALNANPEIDVAIPMPRSEIMFWIRALHEYVHMYTHTYIYTHTHIYIYT